MAGCRRHPVDQGADGAQLALAGLVRQQLGVPGHGGRPYR
jgi:hypothetical protein